MCIMGEVRIWSPKGLDWINSYNKYLNNSKLSVIQYFNQKTLKEISFYRKKDEFGKTRLLHLGCHGNVKVDIQAPLLLKGS